MSFQSYEKMVSTLRKQGGTILLSLSASSIDIWHAATGVSTEAGELLDAAKKLVIYNKPLDRKNIIEELGDLEFYMEQMRQAIEVSRDETLTFNMEKLYKRYGVMYEDSAALKRADKENDE